MMEAGEVLADYQLAQVAIMHFEHGMSQQEVANLLGYSKMTVSRMLQKAKDVGIVKTNIKLPFELDHNLESKLIKAYNLKKVWIVKNNGKDSPTDTLDLIGKACAFFLNTTPMHDCTVGIGVGLTIGQVVKNLMPMKTENIHVVQLMGGLPDVANENPFTIIQETCRKWNAAGTFLTSFATAESKEARDSLFQNSDVGKLIVDLWKKCDIAIFGIGSIEKGTLLSPKLVKVEEIEALKRKGAIGDVLGHCFDVNGEFIQSDLEDRLVTIPVSLLKNIKERRAVAFGHYKAVSLQGALRSGLINELFTDQKTAEMLR